MSSTTILALERVSVGYGRNPVLTGISIELPRGSYVGLLGANGSGKTTLLKTILGILPPLGGRIVFAGGRRPALGYVPQSDTLDQTFPLTAVEVVLMGTYGAVSPGKRLPASKRQLAQDCLVATGCADLAGQAFHELSGGQKQRVLIARALATEPEFLVLDEPTAGIDAASAQQVLEVIARLNRERGITVLMVNHDLAVMRSEAQLILWVQRGAVRVGRPAELLAPERLAELIALPTESRA